MEWAGPPATALLYSALLLWLALAAFANPHIRHAPPPAEVARCLGKGTEFMAESTGRALYIVNTWVPEEQFDEWYRWYADVHMPEIAEQPGVTRATRYRVVEDKAPAEWTPQYVTVFEFESLDALERYRASDEAARLRADHAVRYGATGRISRQVLVEDVSVPGSAAGKGGV